MSEEYEEEEECMFTRIKRELWSNTNNSNEIKYTTMRGQLDVLHTARKSNKKMRWTKKKNVRTYKEDEEDKKNKNVK